MSNVNQQVINAEQALVQNMSSVSFGTIIRGFRSSKGLDYLVTGINPERKEIYAIKANAVNNDGTVHAAVRRHNRVFKYSTTPSGRIGIIKGVTSVMGQKRGLDPAVISRFNHSINQHVGVIPFTTVQLYTQPLNDRRQEYN